MSDNTHKGPEAQWRDAPVSATPPPAGGSMSDKVQSRLTRKFKPVKVERKEAQFAVELNGVRGQPARHLTIWSGKRGYVWIGETDGPHYATLDLSVLRRLLAAVDEWEASR